MPAPLTPSHSTFGVLEPFRKEMEEVMERFFGDAGHRLPARPWAPRVDVEETDKEILVKADLPGVDPKAVEIAVENGVLTVRGERKEEREEKRKNCHRVERFAGSFYRAIPLPPGADAERVTATSTNGVVTVSIPKKTEAQPRKITVTPKA
jgi:HSP20 family protein